MMERRDFIQACAVVLGSSVLPIGCGQSGGEPGETTLVDEFSLPDLSRNRWIDIPSTTFSVAHDTFGAVDMELTAVEDGTFTAEADQFTITLTGPELPLLAEDRYSVYNDSLGYIELYLQPGESPAGEQRYRAIFSLLS